jgi:hypothetical protein
MVTNPPKNTIFHKDQSILEMLNQSHKRKKPLMIGEDLIVVHHTLKARLLSKQFQKPILSLGLPTPIVCPENTKKSLSLQKFTFFTEKQDFERMLAEHLFDGHLRFNGHLQPFGGQWYKKMDTTELKSKSFMKKLKDI